MYCLHNSFLGPSFGGKYNKKKCYFAKITQNSVNFIFFYFPIKMNSDENFKWKLQNSFSRKSFEVLIFDVAVPTITAMSTVHWQLTCQTCFADSISTIIFPSHPEPLQLLSILSQPLSPSFYLGFAQKCFWVFAKCVIGIKTRA